MHHLAHISTKENGIIDIRAALRRHAIRQTARIPDRAHALGMEHVHHSRAGPPPRPISDAPASYLLLKFWRRALYCRHSDRHWAHTVPPTARSIASYY